MSLSRSGNTTTADTKTPESFRLYKVTLTNYDGEDIDISPLVQKFSIQENIFLFSSVFEFVIADGANVLETFKITGNETIDIEMRKKGREGGSEETLKKQLYVVSIPEYSKPSPNAQVYTIKAVAREGYLAKVKRISKSYTGSVGEIISKIYNEELGGKITVNDSQTVGTTKIVVPNLTIFDTIGWLLQKAVKTNGSPFFLYETGKDGVIFDSYDTMIGREPYDKFHHNYTYTKETYSEEDFEQKRRRISEITSNLGFSTYNGYMNGGFTAKTHKLDYAQKTYEVEDFNALDGLIKIDREVILADSFSIGDDNSSTITNPKNYYININSQAFEDSGTNNLYYDYSTGAAKRAAILANLDQFSHNITVRGDFSIQPGKMIEIQLPKATDPKADNDTSHDELLSGTYMIVGVKHRFDENGYKVDMKIKKDSVKR